jgi:hypothetical protein
MRWPLEQGGEALSGEIQVKLLGPFEVEVAGVKFAAPKVSVRLSRGARTQAGGN